MPIEAIRASSGARRAKAMMTVPRLKSRWARATRRFAAAPLKDPMMIVVQVPRSAPMAISAAATSEISSASRAAIATSMVAELDCMIPANTTPNRKYRQDS